MKKTTKRIKKDSAAKQSTFKFHLDLCGEIFEGEGKTALEALQKLSMPDKISTKGVLTISHGENKKVIPLLIPKVKRLFYPNFQSIIIKQLIYGL